MRPNAVSFFAPFTRALVFAGVASGITVACGGSVRGDVPGVGDPCTPSVERAAGFRGFHESEVTIETGAKECRTQTCLVNHFRGAVSSPYGAGDVPSQCTDRSAARAVYCSCRCANAAGNTDDADDYCACGAGFECASLIGSIGSADDHVSGSYCIKKSTAYDPATSCASSCDPNGATCP